MNSGLKHGTVSTGLLLVAQSGATAFSLNSRPPGVGLELSVNGTGQNSRVSEIMSKYTASEIIAAIQVSLQEFRFKRDAIQDLYSRTANTCDHNELLNYLMELSSDVLALVPGLEYMIHASPGNKYWHANLMTLLISELHRANDIWELADNQLGEIK